MTFVVNSRKLIREEIRKNSWLPILMTVVTFLAYPVRLLLLLGGNNIWLGNPAADSFDIRAYRIRQIYEILGQGDWFTGISIGFAALICACTMFSYLTSREGTDFYHSLALSRRQLYGVKFMAGWLSAVLPYLACVLLAYLLSGIVYGVFTLQAAGMVGRAVLFFITVFTACYAVCILAMILTGRILTGFLLGVFFLLYGPVTYGMLRLLVLDGLATYCRWSDRGSIVAWLLSPYALPYLFVRNTGDWELVSALPDQVGYHAGILALLLLYLLAALILGIAIYKKRPSELAGQALYNRRMESVIKVLVSVPAGILFGQLTSARMGFGDEVTVVFSVIGCFLAGAVMEFIYTRDLANTLRFWKSGLIALGLTCLFLLGIMLDPFGYDSYLPEKDRIAAMSMVPEEGIQDLGDYYFTNPGQDAFGKNGFLEQTQTEDFDAVYQLADAGVKYAAQHRQYRISGKAVYEDSSESPTCTVLVCFKLTKGRRIYRQYVVPADMLVEAENQLSREPAYREALYPVHQIDPNKVDSVYVEYWNLAAGPGISLGMTEREKKLLIEALRQDMDRTDLARLRESTPVAMAYFNGANGASTVTTDDICDVTTVYLYPEYEETLKLLAGMGYDLAKGNNGTGEIIKLQVNTDAVAYTLTDVDAIREFLDLIQVQKGNLYASSGCYVTVTYGSDGSERYQPGVLLNDQALELLEERASVGQPWE